MTSDPDVPGTTICHLEDTEAATMASTNPVVLAVVHRPKMTMVTLKSLKMWQETGFLARFFAPFKERGISVDLIATSQASVTVTLDHIPGGIESQGFTDLVEVLKGMGNVSLKHDVSSVSVVGRRLRKILHNLSKGFRFLSGVAIEMLSQSSEDHNLSLVVSDDSVVPLVKQLHSVFIPHEELPLTELQGVVFGPSWTSLKAAIMERSSTDSSHLRSAASPGADETNFNWSGRWVLVTGCGTPLADEFVCQLMSSKAHVIAGCAHGSDPIAVKESLLAHSPEGDSCYLQCCIPFDVESGVDHVASLKECGVTVIDVLFAHNGSIGGFDTQQNLMELEGPALGQSCELSATCAVKTVQAILPLMQSSSVKKISLMTSRLASISEVPVDGSGVQTNVCSRIGQAALNMTGRVLAGELGPQGFSLVMLSAGCAGSMWNADQGDLNLVRQSSLGLDNSVKGCLKVVGELDPTQNGVFLNYDGSELPW